MAAMATTIVAAFLTQAILVIALFLALLDRSTDG